MDATSGWERIAHHAHLYVLPAVGSVALAVAAMAFLGIRTGVGLLVPSVLVLVGGVALVGSVASHACLPRGDAVEAPASSTPAEAAVRPPAPEAHASSRPSTRSSHAAVTPHSGIGRAAVSRYEQTGDELWHHWQTPKEAPLGATLAGPVPETAYSPHKSGAFVAFPDRDRDAVQVTRPSRAAGRARADPRPAAPATGSRQADVILAPRGQAGQPSTMARARDVEGFGSVLSGRGALLSNLDVMDYSGDLESINPILARLGPEEARNASNSGAPRGPGSAKRLTASVCSACSQRLSDFRSWVECRVCRRSFCRDCLPQSFQGEHGGTCLDCRAEQSRRSAVRIGVGNSPGRSGLRSAALGS